MSGRMQVGFQFGRTEARPQPVRERSAEEPMRILVLGDFSGRGGRRDAAAADELAERPIRKVDIDNFDEVMGRIGPRLELKPGDDPSQMLGVAFEQLEDFHPDALYRSMDLLRPLRELRSRLRNPATWREAAEELRRWAAAPPAAAPEAAAPEQPPEPPPEQPEKPAGGADDIERLLGRRPTSAPPGRATVSRRPGGPDITGLIRDMIAPHIVPAADPQQSQFIAAVDDAIGRQMRAVLHDPHFRGLEAAWRALHGLITSLETGEELHVCILDVSREEMTADLMGAADNPQAPGRDFRGQASGLYKLLVEKTVHTPGTERWSLLVGDYTFGASERDAAVLEALGAIASRAGAAFVAGAEPMLIGCRSFHETPDPGDWSAPAAEARKAWEGLRRSPHAASIGLALPRILARVPYGADSEPIESFAFEELPDPADHEAYLWGNPAFGCALLLGESFTQSNWAMAPGDHLQLDDLPAFTYQEHGERKLKACAEAYLSERAAETILRAGLMPVLSYAHRNSVRLMRFQSIADPPAALRGPWS